MDTEIKLQEVLAKKSKIELRVLNSSMRYTTIVENVQGDLVTLAFPEMFSVTDIALADTIIFRFSDGTNEYSFAGDLESMEINFPQILRVRLIGEVSIIGNARGSDRTETLFLSNIFVHGEKTGLHSYVKEVSDKGIRVVSRYSLTVGSEVGIDIVLPMRNIFDSVVKLRGRIVWTKTINIRNEYGIEITEMDDLNRGRLKMYLDMYSV